MSENHVKETAAAVDLIAERDKLQRESPAIADSYRQFVQSYAKYRRVEHQFKKKEARTLQSQNEARLPA